MTKYSWETIEELRISFVQQFLQKHGGKHKIKYLGVVTLEDIGEEGMEYLNKKTEGHRSAYWISYVWNER